MGTKAQISPEEYLATHFEWEPEYVRGELRQRPMPDRVHATVKKRMMMLLSLLEQQHAVAAFQNLRCHLAQEVYRLPDITLVRTEPFERIPVSPALMVAEVLSRDDVYLDLVDKMAEYAAWGVPHIWLIDPWSKRLHVWTDEVLQLVPRLELPEFNWTCTIDDLMKSLPAEATQR